MTLKEIELHPGHWNVLNSGANGIINEVKEARKVTKRVYEILKASNVPCTYFEDNSSTNQSQNLSTIVKHHNADCDGLVVSIHFNSSGSTTNKGIGTEVFYSTQKELAAKVSFEIAAASGLINRGAKYSDKLAVLTKTYEPAILIEVCFVNSSVDVAIYRRDFEKICQTIAKALANHVGCKIKPSTTTSSIVEEKEEEITLTETGREEARALIRKAVKKGVFKAAAHTEEKINKYTDAQLLSYTIAYVNRTAE